MMRSVVSGANFCTASLLADRERTKEIDVPPFRRICRLILTCATLVTFTLVVTMVLLSQPPKRSERRWITGRDYENVTEFLDKMALQLNSAEWNCPCDTIDTISKRETKANMVDFYLLREEEGPLHVKNIDQLCTFLNDSSDFKGFYNSCNDLLNDGFQSSGWSINEGNRIYMNSMGIGRLNPLAFMYDVCMSWSEGISQASASFLISYFRMNEHEALQLQKLVKGIKTALKTCAMNTMWPPPGRDLYASKANATDSKLIKTAVEFNWTQYMAMCAPSYCDHFKMNSRVWNLFTAFAQMGGLISVAVFVLRAIVWPIVCFAGGWPTGLIGGSTPNRKDEESATPTQPYKWSLKRSKSVLTF